MKLQKFNTKGGQRPPKKPKTGQQMLLRALVSYFGGATRMARILGTLNGEEVGPQMPLNWVMRGRVPLEVVGEVSRKLKIDKFALNYSQCSAFVGHDPLWEEIVEELPLPSAAKQKILNLPKPKGHNETNPFVPTSKLTELRPLPLGIVRPE